MSKVENTIRICKKANKLYIGEPLIEAIRHNNIYFVIIATDCGANNAKKISDKCKFYNVEFKTILDCAKLGELINHKCVAIGVSDYNLSLKLKDNMKLEGFYEE